MIKKLRDLLGAKSNIGNGLVALLIISLIVLGCTCNEKDGFNWGTKDSDSTESSDTDKNEDGDRDEEKDKDEDESFKASEDEVPTDAQATKLAEGTLMSFNEAIQDEDFTDFLKTVSKARQRSSKPSDLKKSFKDFISKNIDIGDIRGNKPKFDPDPYIKKKYGKKLLFLEGKYRSTTPNVRFDLAYMVEGDEWKLVDIGVYTGDK